MPLAFFHEPSCSLLFLNDFSTTERHLHRLQHFSVMSGGFLRGGRRPAFVRAVRGGAMAAPEFRAVVSDGS